MASVIMPAEFATRDTPFAATDAWVAVTVRKKPRPPRLQGIDVCRHFSSSAAVVQTEISDGLELPAVWVAAAGLFVAMLAIGGGWGRLMGMAVQALLGGAGGFAPRISLPAYTIVGGAAMLGARPPAPGAPASRACMPGQGHHMRTGHS